MTTHEDSTAREISKFDEWQLKWLPFQNPYNQKTDWDGTYFDHYGSFGDELKQVKAQNPRRVWSLMSLGCEGWTIVSGIQPHAYGYFITKKKRRKDDKPLTVVIEPDHDCNDPSFLGLH
jgi:hypothetical protein